MLIYITNRKLPKHPDTKKQKITVKNIGQKLETSRVIITYGIAIPFHCI